MGHAPFPGGATGTEIATIQRLHRTAERHQEPEVREALTGALGLIVELIEDRGRRRDLGDQWDQPPGAGRRSGPATNLGVRSSW
jgi:hypothetical protein